MPSGFCQWLRENWKRLNYFSPLPIQGENQTTQAPYCAAYLSVLATKYGIVHSGAVRAQRRRHERRAHADQGRAARRRGVRDPVLAGLGLARDLRALPGKDYKNVYRSYGPRSYLYAEMVFGNTFNVRADRVDVTGADLRDANAARDYARRDRQARTHLPADEVRRFNPALVERVPAQATLYLPSYVGEFGPDVAFWRRPASPSYAAVLDDFLRLEPAPSDGTTRRSRHPGELQAPVQRNEHGGRGGDGDRARICDGPGIHEPTARAPHEFRHETGAQVIERGMGELGASRDAPVVRAAAGATS